MNELVKLENLLGEVAAGTKIMAKIIASDLSGTRIMAKIITKTCVCEVRHTRAPYCTVSQSYVTPTMEYYGHSDAHSYRTLSVL